MSRAFPPQIFSHDLPPLLSRHISPPGPSPITHGVMLAPQLCQLLSKPPLHHMLPVGVGGGHPTPCFQGRKHPTEEPGAADARPQLQDPGSQGLGPLRPARLHLPHKSPPSTHTHTAQKASSFPELDVFPKHCLSVKKTNHTVNALGEVAVGASGKFRVFFSGKKKKRVLWKVNNPFLTSLVGRRVLPARSLEGCGCGGRGCGVGSGGSNSGPNVTDGLGVVRPAGALRARGTSEQGRWTQAVAAPPRTSWSPRSP